MTDKNFSLDFALAGGSPTAEAKFRQAISDFQVREQLGFALADTGEHLCLHIEKKDQNTRWVAKQLAEILGIEEKEIGYCGMKDRRAITSQWFSVTGINDLDSVNLGEGMTVLAMTRHNKKLRRGMHSRNDFIIRLCEVSGNPNEIDTRLDVIANQGVPNYFGEQRFGFDAGNLHEADRILARLNQPGSRKRGTRKLPQRGGIYLSAARSYLFNLVLSARVRNNTWQVPIGEEETPTGPLWGRGRNPAVAPVREFESQQLVDWQDWCLGMEHSGLQQERRPLKLTPINFNWKWEEGNLVLSFSLGPGGYATAVLREICRLNNCSPAAQPVLPVL